MYDRYKAVEYALKWALGRNPDFPDYSSNTGGGGDCANFVSQVMLAGGLESFWGNELDPGVWWCTTDRRSSWSWKSAKRLQGYLDVSGRASPCGRDDLALGDIVFQKIDGSAVHAMVVTAIGAYSAIGPKPQARFNVMLSYHSRDMRNRPLDDILRQYEGNPRMTYAYWKVASTPPPGRRWMMANEGTPPNLFETYPPRKSRRS